MELKPGKSIENVPKVSSENFKKVLVIGTAGVGKTSLIREVTGVGEEGKNSAKSQTQHIQSIIDLKEDVIYFDTNGLDGIGDTIKTNYDNLMKLFNFVITLSHSFDAVIYVQSGRLLESFVNNYMFIEKILFKFSKPRKILFCTHNENEPEDDIYTYGMKQKGFFNHHGLFFDHYLSGGFPKSHNLNIEHHLKPIRQNSADCIRAVISELPTQNPDNKINSFSFMERFVEIWNSLMSHLNVKNGIIWKSNKIVQLLKEINNIPILTPEQKLKLQDYLHNEITQVIMKKTKLPNFNIQ